MNKFFLKISRFAFILLLIFCLGSCQNQEKINGVSVKFQKVISGNMIEILWTKEGNTKVEKVRLMGINAPELKQEPWGKNAQKKLEELLTSNLQSLDLILELDKEERDQYGRFWGYIWYENQLINEQIVKEGFALINPCPPILPKKATFVNQTEKYCPRLFHAQQYARLMGLGIWNPTNPMRE